MAAARNSCTGNRGKTVEKVAAVKCYTDEPEKVYEAIKEALRRLDFVVPENKTVLLKPNILSQNKPAQHTITH